MLTPNSASQLYLEAMGQPALPRLEIPGGRTIEKPRREWLTHQIRWRFLLDSWEGGEAYRLAEYGYDLRGLPVKNLIRHKHEYPLSDATLPINVSRPAGTDPAFQATDDDYQLRLARTPIPTFLAECVGKHTAAIYEQEIRRGPKPDKLAAWHADVDGRGTTIDQWMADAVAPLLLVLGQLDLCFDHPPATPGSRLLTRMDELEQGLGKCVASYILPDNIPWWRMDARGKYTEVLVREQAGEATRWRYWTPEFWCLYDAKGNPIPEGASEAPSRYRDGMGRYSGARPIPVAHPFGVIPIVRVFDKQRPRCREVGLPRYENIAEKQREYYNRDSELILSDTTQAHPLLQGPEDYILADGTVPIGPSNLLPKKKNTSGGNATYEDFSVIEFPKAGADSIRANKADLRDDMDRSACLVKPAGAGGSDGSTVAQSGVSKRLDHAEGNTLLSSIATVLERVETEAAKMALTVLNDGRPEAIAADVALLEFQYPRQFDLFTSVELADVWARLQVVLNSSGSAPEAEYEIGTKLLRLMLPGSDDAKLARLDAELKQLLARKAAQIELGARQQRQMAEASDAEDPADAQAEADDAQVAAMPSKLGQVATGNPSPTPNRPDEK